MLNWDRAPEAGTMYAMFIDKIVYQKYKKSELVSVDLDEKKLLELHLFDKEKEYRVVRTRGHGLQEYEITDDCGHDDCYEEKIYVSGRNVDRQDDLKEQVTVVNYITYDKNDLLHVGNYRLKEAE